MILPVHDIAENMVITARTIEEERAQEIQERRKQAKFRSLVTKRENVEGPSCQSCGKSLLNPLLRRKSQRKYCSKQCEGRAARGNMVARLDLTRLKRREARRLKYSIPLFFN